ncbi:hypothetical protein EDD15DRAFT_2190681 [Pisolithus albus]|nr:hypothetical protein EDD15DRAFT_2190681 [Pisolithus albus]
MRTQIFEDVLFTTTTSGNIVLLGVIKLSTVNEMEGMLCHKSRSCDATDEDEDAPFTVHSRLLASGGIGRDLSNNTYVTILGVVPSTPITPSLASRESWLIISTQKLVALEDVRFWGVHQAAKLSQVHGNNAESLIRELMHTDAGPCIRTSYAKPIEQGWTVCVGRLMHPPYGNHYNGASFLAPSPPCSGPQINSEEADEEYHYRHSDSYSSVAPHSALPKTLRHQVPVRNAARSSGVTAVWYSHTAAAPGRGSRLSKSLGGAESPHNSARLGLGGPGSGLEPSPAKTI